MDATGFALPAFYQYPPYFTLQPVKETRDRQSALWGQLILAYCKHNKIFLINTQEDFPLFVNSSISRRLSQEAATAFLDDLATAGNIEWLDKTKRQALVLWRKVPEWAALIHSFVKTYGLGDSVMVVDELSSGDDVKGSELEGVSREVLIRALKLLEQQGKAKLFHGSTPEEEGVKFL